MQLRLKNTIWRNFTILLFFLLIGGSGVVLSPVGAKELLRFDVVRTSDHSSALDIVGFPNGINTLSIYLINPDNSQTDPLIINTDNNGFYFQTSYLEIQEGTSTVVIESDEDSTLLVGYSLYPAVKLVWTEEPGAEGYRIEFPSNESSTTQWAVDVGDALQFFLPDIALELPDATTLKLNWSFYGTASDHIAAIIPLRPPVLAGTVDLDIASESRKAKVFIEKIEELDKAVTIEVHELLEPSTYPIEAETFSGRVIGGGRIDLYSEGVALAQTENTQIGLNASVTPAVTNILGENFYSEDEWQSLSENGQIQLYYYELESTQWKQAGEGRIYQTTDRDLGVGLKGTWILEPKEGVKLDQLYPYWVYVMDSGSQLNFQANWNLASFPDYTQQTLEAWFVPLQSVLEAVWKWNGNQWEVWSSKTETQEQLSKEFSSFSDLQTDVGYWLNIRYPKTLIQNSLADHPHVWPNLVEGWNLIGTRGKGNLPISLFVEGLESQIESIWSWENNRWKLWMSDQTITDFNDQHGTQFLALTHLEERKGYWVKSKTAIETYSPVVSIGGDQTVPVGNVVRLGLGNTHHPQGEEMVLEWTITKPGGETQTFSEKEIELVVEQLGTYQVALTASVGNRSDSQTIQVLGSLGNMISITTSTLSFNIDDTEVTQQQFALFWKDGGYTNDTYWSSDGWQWRLSPNGSTTPVTIPLGWRNTTPPYKVDWEKDFDSSGNFQPEEPYLKFTAQKGFPLDRTKLAVPVVKGSGDIANSPMIGVSWYEAEAFCKWAGKRLPTDEEWLAAAQGEAQRSFPWGEAPPMENKSFRANFYPLIGNGRIDADGYQYTAPVGYYDLGKTPEGVYDMAGNVKEWTATPQGNNYLIKGGSWRSFGSDLLKNSAKTVLTPASRDSDLGFRCVQ